MALLSKPDSPQMPSRSDGLTAGTRCFLSRVAVALLDPMPTDLFDLIEGCDSLSRA
jgi:hypothetical protein